METKANDGRPRQSPSVGRLCRRWAITMPNGQRRTVYKALGISEHDLARMFPDAKLEPIDEKR